MSTASTSKNGISNLTTKPSLPAWSRRDFLRSALVGAGALSLGQVPVMAGPFTPEEFDRLVPADKKLSPEWLRSLTERGTRTVYTGTNLDKIGMPIGGLFSGQLYLGGDGRLWHWDIFNQKISTGADHYANPMKAVAPVEQKFTVTVTKGAATRTLTLDKASWKEVSFTGEYPIGYVKYRDPGSDVAVDMEAFSPFIPLNTEDSSLPLTVLEFTLHNTSREKLTVELSGLLENAVCRFSGANREGFRRNRAVRRPGVLALEASAEAPPERPRNSRPDITFDDFEREGYGDWAATGTAFGSGPVEQSKIPEYQGKLDGHGQRVVNTHAAPAASTVETRDNARGTLTSAPFTISRDYITFLIGGGSHVRKTCLDLIVDGQTVLSQTGRNDNRMRPATWDVRRWAGKTAQLKAIDDEPGPWGNIGFDDIVFTDSPKPAPLSLGQEPDFGTMTLGLLEPTKADRVCTEAAQQNTSAGDGAQADPVKRPFSERLVGSVTRSLTLKAGATAKVVFVLAWHMPNFRIDRLPPGRHYATRFSSAVDAADYASRNMKRLAAETRLWHDTWYDSSLPWWFLDRTFLNTSILATSTCHRLGNGRFYAWEGVGCCEGTCGHVWQYAHAMARLFPDLERKTREDIDFGSALQRDGAIHFRGELNDIPAIDAQAGTVLRALREHQCSTDDSFLKRTWPAIKRATDWLIAKDANGDGIIESNQHNTLDTDWFGPVAWLSGMYLAALEAAALMANLVGDPAYADKCMKILSVGRENILSLYDGDYFINKPDPKHLDAINSGTGCHIDQVFGQSWAFQVGLPRVLPEGQTRQALRSLWRYNFTPDVGPYRERYRPGRWYAMAGEAGLLMCTFPRTGWDYAQAKGKGPEWAAGYFNECMNGFEYQVAGHMLWENMVMEGMAITRAVHDRYHASRRNPWNEIECGDHYARSMASYGVYLAACGFSYDGPKRHMGFAPRINREKFKCAFTGSEGWGTFSHEVSGKGVAAQLAVKWGELKLDTLSIPSSPNASIAEARIDKKKLPCTRSLQNGVTTIHFEKTASIKAGQILYVHA